MKGIALISQKSGSGKTTLATSLATQGYIEGLKTLLIDLDPQGSSYKWGKRRTIPAPYCYDSPSCTLPRISKSTQRQKINLGFSCARAMLVISSLMNFSVEVSKRLNP
jgi:hypothetical protein